MQLKQKQKSQLKVALKHVRLANKRDFKKGFDHSLNIDNLKAQCETTES